LEEHVTEPLTVTVECFISEIPETMIARYYVDHVTLGSHVYVIRRTTAERYAHLRVTT